jgi:hypothetical protein
MRPSPRFTQEEKAIICTAGQRVWEEIGYDVMTMVQQEEKKDWIPRSHVLELVCDAGRLEDKIPSTQSELRYKVTNASSAQLYRILRDVFPHARYGM